MDAGVCGQIRWGLWHTCLRDILRATADDKMLLPERPRDEPGVREIAAAHRKIDPIGDHIDDAIFEIDVEFDLGKDLPKRWQKRHQEVMADDMRHAQPQSPTRTIARLRDHGCRVVEIIEKAATSFEKDGSFIRQADTARRSVQKPDAEPGLKPCNAFCNRRRRKPQNPTRRDEASLFGRVNEGGDAAEVVH